MKSQLSCYFTQLRFPPNSCKTLSISLRKSPVNNLKFITIKFQDSRFSSSSLPLLMIGSYCQSSQRGCNHWGRNLSSPRLTPFPPSNYKYPDFSFLRRLKPPKVPWPKPGTNSDSTKERGTRKPVLCCLLSVSHQGTESKESTQNWQRIEKEFKCDESQCNPVDSTGINTTCQIVKSAIDLFWITSPSYASVSHL